MQKKPSKELPVIKRDSKIDFAKSGVYHVVKGKIFFDTETNMPIGHTDVVKRVSGLIFVGIDEELPEFTNKPQWIEIRECHMVVLKSSK